jgi:hypothetical protein
MDYSKLKLEENNKINIFGNMVIKNTIEDMEEKEKYMNYFYKDGEKDEIKKYVFYFLLAEKNMEILMDSVSILNGELLNNKYNIFLSEDNIILLFLRIKIYIISGISSLNYNPIFQNIYDTKILKYENFLEKDNRLLEKDLNDIIKKKIILKEIKKVRISSLGFYLLLSYYVYKFNKTKKTELDKNKFLVLIDNVEKIIENFLDKDENLNIELDDFWKYLISYI